MTKESTRRQDGQGWDLPVRGERVIRVAFDYQTRLLFESGVEIVFGCPFTLAGSGTAVVDPDIVATLSPALGLLRDTAVAASADDDGLLALDFESGLQVRSGFHEQYESWEANGAGVAPPESVVSPCRRTGSQYRAGSDGNAARSCHDGQQAHRKLWWIDIPMLTSCSN